VRTPPRILIVDDVPANVHILQSRLAANGYDIVTATDGEAALAAVKETQPDLILLDVMMPRMSGFEVCQKIKSSPRTRDIIVIMVTALHEVADLERAVECGTDEFLTKPVNKLELLTRVKSLLRVSLLQRKLNRLLALNRRIAPDERAGEPDEAADEGAQ
jgi:CheY-like chemotaxis protein